MIDSSCSSLFSWSHSQKDNLKAALLPLHYVNSWGVSDGGRPQKAWQNPNWENEGCRMNKLISLSSWAWSLTCCRCCRDPFDAWLLQWICRQLGTAGVLPGTFLSLGRGWLEARISESVLGIHCCLMWYIISSPEALHICKQFEILFNVSGAKKIFASKGPTFHVLFSSS